MKKLLTVLLAFVACSSLSAQRYILKDGKVLNAADVKLKGANLVQSIADGAEVSFPVANVVRLDWPEPEEIAQARQLLASGSSAEAVEKITPVFNQFAPFAKVPGGWWTDAALLRARALLAQRKDDEAQRATREIMSTSVDSNVVAAAQLLLARVQMNLEKHDIADAMLDQILQQEVSSDVAARAVVLRGDIAFARKDFEKALEYYLQVPAFYGTQDEVMPAAMLGSARSFVGYGDRSRAERAYLDVIVAYPESAEATVAKTESAKL